MYATATKVIVNREAYFDRPKIIAASQNFFSFFSYELLTNNPETALEAKNNIVISEKLAKKYFGVSDPIGPDRMILYKLPEGLSIAGFGLANKLGFVRCAVVTQ